MVKSSSCRNSCSKLRSRCPNSSQFAFVHNQQLILSLTLSLSSLSFRSLHRSDLTVAARGRAAQEGCCAELACSTVTAEKRVSTKSPRCAQCAPPNPLTIAAFFLSDATPVLLQRGVDRGGKPDSVGMRAHVRKCSRSIAGSPCLIFSKTRRATPALP